MLNIETTHLLYIRLHISKILSTSSENPPILYNVNLGTIHMHVKHKPHPFTILGFIFLSYSIARVFCRIVHVSYRIMRASNRNVRVSYSIVNVYNRIVH